MKGIIQISATIILALVATWSVRAVEFQLKDIARFEGVRDNALVGYGLVVGLKNSGDTRKNQATVQSIANTLTSFGVFIDQDEINSRNVAAVMLTATLPAFSSAGNKIDVVVSSLGDAKSLQGGTLVLTPLKAANQKIYALAQGPVSVGGYQFDSFNNLEQKNHTTVGQIPDGATIERGTQDDLINPDGRLHILLKEADFATAARVENALNAMYPESQAKAINASRIAIKVPEKRALVGYIADVEQVSVDMALPNRVVINERTGTVVSGAAAIISPVTISHGSLRLSIRTDYQVSQPALVFTRNSEGVTTAVTPDTEIEVKESQAQALQLPGNSTVNDLVEALGKIKASSRDVITILQSIKRAGALHAELIIQ